jgi:hypothetical protein
MGLVPLILGWAILASPALAAQAVGPVQILVNTPLYVWALLALLVALGLAARRPRELSAWRVAILPVAFFLWGTYGLATRLGHDPGLALPWAGAALVGVFLGWLGRRSAWRIDPETRRVVLAGSWRPLFVNLAIFTVKYGLAVAMVLATARRAELAPVDIAVSGLMAGYFVTRLTQLAILWSRPEPAPPLPAEGGR